MAGGCSQGQPGGARQLQFVLINPAQNKATKWQERVINQSVPWPISTFLLPESYLRTKWESVVLNAASLLSHHPQSLLEASPMAGSKHKPGGLSAVGLIQLRTPTPTAATQPQGSKTSCACRY